MVEELVVDEVVEEVVVDEVVDVEEVVDADVVVEDVVEEVAGAGIGVSEESRKPAAAEKETTNNIIKTPEIINSLE